MKLQIAIDTVSARQALQMVGEIHDIIDIVEVGTPMIVREGMAAVRAVKDRYPGITVLADAKIIDGGELEARYAFEAGADIVTVLALAADETIAAVVKTAERFGRRTMADMINAADIIKRAAALDIMGVDYLCVHTAVDVQGTGRTPYRDLAAVRPVLRRAKVAVAGGVNLQAVPLLLQMRPDVIVAGSALTSSPDLRAAVLTMQKAIHQV